MKDKLNGWKLNTVNSPKKKGSKYKKGRKGEGSKKKKKRWY